jgi:hypothetical protein
MSPSRVVSVNDLPYNLHATNAYHPLCKDAALRRLSSAYPALASPLSSAFGRQAHRSSWGIVIERSGTPLLVLQNIGLSVRNNAFRRVLRVDVNDTLRPRYNTLRSLERAGCDPWTLVRNVQ